MKNILVPTDFSATSINAIRVAFELAADFDAQIHLFSCIDITPNWSTMTLAEKQKAKDDLQTIHNVKLLFQEWIDYGKKIKIPVHTSYSSGKLSKNIKRLVDTKNIDFIVMGSHGASGKNEFFIGSNTQHVVRKVHCPVLVIKEDLSDYHIDKVIFVSNFAEKEKKAFQYFLDFTAEWDVEIHLVEINTSGWYSQAYGIVQQSMESFAAMCKDRPHKIHFFKDWSIDAGVRKLAKEIGADLIAISNTKRRPIKRMIAGSNVELLINHSKIPVLSIDFEKESEKGSASTENQRVSFSENIQDF